MFLIYFVGVFFYSFKNKNDLSIVFRAVSESKDVIIHQCVWVKRVTAASVNTNLSQNDS